MELFGYVLDSQELLVFATVGLLIGMSKVGIAGGGMIAVPLLAILFGGRESTGIMLPILIIADVFGVGFYHRHAKWEHLRKLLPYALSGIVLGTFFGSHIDDNLFKITMAVIIFLSLGIMVWMEMNAQDSVPKSKAFAITTGMVGGFTTMVGNLAGSVMSLYLLAMRLPKNEFIGTSAWFFLVINIAKVPFHVLAWQTITLQSFLLGIVLVPAIALGAFAGLLIVRRIPEKLYRYFIMIMTLVACVFMIL